MSVRIVDLDRADHCLRERLAELSHAAAASQFPHWFPALDDAREEIAEACAAERITRVAVDDDGSALGWVSCMHQYGQVWELHPLLVAPQHHGRGVGRRLVEEVERIVASRGAGVLVLSTADETGATSLAHTDLYADPLGALARISIAPDHPLRFWLRLGFTIVGVTPDAEGPGMPTIHLAKRP